MMTSFQGFRGEAGSDKGGFVNQMGGITLNVPKPGLSERVPVPVKAGRNVLSGAQALSWSRNRHERPRGDFDRSLAQGTLIVAALAEARSDYAENPGTVLRNLAVLRRNLRMNISIPEALKLGLFAMRIKPSNVTNQVIDGQVATAGDASVVKITSKGRSQLVDICSDGQLGS
jgi:anionic cell wall polymer biosynthesis LytR-Cps2A-Psr (LCP) family protein